MIKVIGFLLLIGMTFVSFAQNPNPLAFYKVEKYDSKSGMPADFITNTYQTKDGFIWMTTYNGYLRFDGKKFTNFNSTNTPLIKTDNNSSLFIESKDSTLWLPTGMGLLAYKNGIFKSYLTNYPNIFLQGTTKNGDLILSSTKKDKRNWLVFNITTHQSTTIKEDDFLSIKNSTGTDKTTEKDNWFVKDYKIIHKEKNGVWRTLGEKEGIRSNIFFHKDGFFVDSKNRVWLTSLYGLFLWDGLRFNLFPGMEKMVTPNSNPSFGYMTEDNQQGIWASIDNTLAYLPNNESRFLVFPKQFINIQTLQNISIDREQNIWVATDRGLYKISKTKVVNYAEAEGIINNRVSSVSEISPNKFLITSTNDQLYILENKKIRPFKIADNKVLKEVKNFISNTADSKGNIWLGHQKGVLCISKNKVINFKTPNQVRYIEEGKDGKIYIAVAFTGIGIINERKELKMLNVPNADFSLDYFSSLHHLKDGSILTTTYRTGAMIIAKNGDIKKIDLFNGITGIAIFNAFELTDGTIWFATAKGLIKLQNDKVVSIDKNAELPESAIFGILPDKSGNWWFPSNKGIIYAPYSEIDLFTRNNKAKINWKIIDDADGMNNKQCVGARHSIIGSDGNLYVVSIGGLVEVNPEKLLTNNLPPLVSINQLRVDDSLYFSKQVNNISPGSHRYIFEYSALSFVAPEKNKIYFRLVGQDADWIRSTGENRAIYTNLSPGKYRFEVKATNNDGVWSENSVNFEFTVQPFFYQTNWFKVAVVIFSILLIWQIINWRTSVVREANIRLENIVNQRTKELQESLENLKQTQSQLIQSEKMASLGELTAGIAHEIQNPLNFVNNFSELNVELIEELKGIRKKVEGDRIQGIGNREQEEEILNDIRENSEKINHHGQRAASIVKGMLQHSRSSSATKEPTDINALCDEYLRLAYHGLRAKDKSFNAEFKTEFDTSIPKVNIVPQDMGRVVLNLINNAFFAVAERSRSEAEKSGIFNLESNEQYTPLVTVTTKNLGNKIEILVSDNGMGIPSEIKEKIFQPFFTTKPTGSGTGLGLSLSYDIVKAHGGEIKLESEGGKGSEFIIQLPI
ncbi:MAG: hypothetical protein IKD55_07825 [Sediminibacterium sp.]|nr:hypothetical protein [Sediminibacterium sp.]